MSLACFLVCLPPLPVLGESPKIPWGFSALPAKAREVGRGCGTPACPVCPRGFPGVLGRHCMSLRDSASPRPSLSPRARPQVVPASPGLVFLPLCGPEGGVRLAGWVRITVVTVNVSCVWVLGSLCAPIFLFWSFCLCLSVSVGVCVSFSVSFSPPSLSLSSRCLSLVCVSLCLHLCLSPPRGPPRPLRLGLCPSPPCPFLCLSPCHRPLPRGFPSHCSRKEGLTDGQFWERPRGLHFSLSWPLPALTLGAFHTRRPDGASKGTRGLLHRPCSTPRRLQEPVLSPTPGRGSRGPPPRAALPPGRHPCPLPL